MKTIYFLIKGFVISFFCSVILFVSAGKIDYLNGWIFLIASILGNVISSLAIHKNTDLIDERSKFGEGTKSWDKLILGLSGSNYIILLIIAGLDSGRYGWSKNFHWSFYGLGIILTYLGQIIFLIAQRQNNYFSSVVRIQKDRGQVVCEDGLYRLIRHPGYLGMIITFIGLPIILGSVLSIFCVLMSIILMIIRTSLEDRMLKEELNGYIEYSHKTKFKLIPKIW
jgi:protein-S-isoprenylcysteine O-methyltransferase Ste14